MKPERPMKEVVDDWAEELATKFGRPVQQILANGLGARDFSCNSSVEVRLPDGHTHRFSFAFALIRASKGQAVVFTEHAGYVEFELVEDAQIVEIHETYYRHET